LDLTYDSELEAFREEVRSFLSENWPQSGDEAIARFRRRAIDAGYLYRHFPRRYGGSEQEANPLKAQIIREEFGQAGAPAEPLGIGPSMLAPTLLERGTEWQKEHFIPKTLTGEYVWCQGYSEPGSGSDLASLRTRGELVGDEWVINGQKVWTSGAHLADYMFCLVRTEPDAPKHKGISYLLIDMKQPGVEVRPLRTMTGTADFNEVFLSDVRTPRDWIVGERGEGWVVSRTTLKHERNSIGGARRTEEDLLALARLAKEATRNGRPAIEDPEIRQRLAMLEGYVQAHKYSGFRQLTKDAKGEPAGIITLMMKLFSTNVGHDVARLAMDLLGDEALLSAGGARLGTKPADAQSWIGRYMYTLGIAVAGGTANIQRNVIAERGLGLPRDAAAVRSSGK
jgi:alkylation response protein AidB-like acyl-CoA dehydrogenase